MPNFSAAHLQSLVLVEEAYKLQRVIKRQVREGSGAAQGDREVQRTGHNIGSALKVIAESISSLAEQCDTLAYEQVGDADKATLKQHAEELRNLAQKFPPMAL